MKYLLIMFVILFSFSAYSGVIFEEDFDTTTWPDDYDFPTGTPSEYDDSCPNCGGAGEWDHAQGEESGEYDSVTHYSGEVTSPGREGADDRSFKAWRGGGNILDVEVGNSKFAYRDSNFHSHRDIYNRWYMKIPTTFTLAEGSCNMNYWKLWRYQFDVNVAGASNQIYFNINGGSFTGADIEITGTQTGDWITLVEVDDVNDGAWHCYEIRIKLNTEGNSDGIVQFWFDGELEVTETGLDYDANDNEYFSRTALGFGNNGARDCTPDGEFQTAWAAIEFDDYVLSDEYIGLSGAEEEEEEETSSIAVTIGSGTAVAIGSGTTVTIQ
ncbi:hypothetical protein [Pseudoalteromonas sp.]|uniref:hypothetical protein n=1 Tax=Pseudoalteromonas sp. TaxID=53249 RepID=UPI002623BB78|nr:hypothetical protein [Pseudoalteromonas sp.]MCP4585314.1 hypothetical protein [Pseudoalteromonas sp.]